MNGFTENRASGASEGTGGGERILTWNASVAMLPLVSRIAQDVVELAGRLDALRAELGDLDRRRKDLDWPRRARRYQIEDEIVAAESARRSACAELDSLGVALLDAGRGMVGFPTLVNDQRAFFCWVPGEETVAYWNYATDRIRRRVPADWTHPLKETAREGKRPRQRRDKR
jgi:hypothetical protein